MSRTPKVEGRKPHGSAVDSSAIRAFTMGFGLFLGLCIWKFGNPVILDNKISPPVTAQEFLNEAWPTHWANWFLLPLTLIGALLVLQNKSSRTPKWLWLLPLMWLGWQFVAATQTVRRDLTDPTLWQYSGCVACYFLGAWLFAQEQRWRWLLVGILIAFTFCLVRAVNQRVFEFPANYQSLTEGQRDGWTNYPPAMVEEMRKDNIIVLTNGMEMANPAILTKFAKGRVSGTLVYPNALAQLVLLLWPVALVLAFGASKTLRPPVRLAAIIMTAALGLMAFFWTGSKLGWLIGVVLIAMLSLRLNWPKKLKVAAIAVVLLVGFGVFAVRFHNYFAAGATSVGARLDYWRAAVQTAVNCPVFGTGPGTFQVPYSYLKAPASEMARLTHNDFLEQFSDSGFLGGLFYLIWIFLAMAMVGKRVWGRRQQPHETTPGHMPNSTYPVNLAIFIGLLGWFIQGFGEFGLFVPALAWTAFTLLGTQIGEL